MQSRLVLFAYLFLFVSINVFSITVDEIMNADNYLFGRGEDSSYRDAELEALQNLSEQFSVLVKSNFEEDAEETNGNVNEYSRSVIQTFSSAFLDNTDKKVIETDDGFIIFKYLPKSDKERIFTNRKNKVYDYASRGQAYLEDLNIGLAMRDFYWALILLKSIPCYDSFVIMDDNKSVEVNLKLYLQRKLETILANISFNITKEEQLSNCVTLYIEADYNGDIINDLCFKYFDGEEQILSNIIDGIGIINLPNSYYSVNDRFVISLDYKYLEVLQKDPLDEEVKALIDIVNPGKFKNRKYLCKDRITKSHNEHMIKTNVVDLAPGSIDKKRMNSMLEDIIDAIKTKEYENIHHYFTEIGYTQFLNLMNYGEVSIYEQNFEVDYYNLDHRVQIKSIPIIVTLKDKQKRTLLDKLSITYEDGRITWISFALDDSYMNVAIKQAAKANDLKERLQCISFLEYYKTIFALKDAFRIEQIFADSAAIFIGYVSKNQEVPAGLKDAIDVQIGDQTIIKRVTKYEYIDRLKNKVFMDNDCVNIQFTDHEIIRRSSSRPIYAIQLHQEYYSTNYSDEGYLMLFIDFTNPREPKIFFRYWQQEHIGEEKQRSIVPGDIRF